VTRAKAGRFGTREECPVCTKDANGKHCILHDPKEQPLDDQETGQFWQAIRETIKSSQEEVVFSKVHFPPFDSGGDANKPTFFLNDKDMFFEKLLFFRFCNFSDAKFQPTKFKQKVDFVNCQCGGDFEFWGATFHDRLNFDFCSFRRIDFDSTKFESKVRFSGDGITNFSFTKTRSN
jgi:hypothetical protein